MIFNTFKIEIEVPFLSCYRGKIISDNTSSLPYQACLIPNLPEDIQHQIRDITNYVVRPLGMLLAVMSFICNALVCITVARTKSLQKPALLMLCSLSITDLIYSPYSLYREMEISRLEHMCPERSSHELVFLSSLCLLATLSNLAVVSTDRYLAVTKPWWYRNHVTKSRAIKIICVQWLVSGVVSFGIYLSKKVDGVISRIGQIFPLLFYTACFIVIMFCYLSLYCSKTRHQNGHSIQVILKREKKLADTVGLILVVLLLTFLPALLCPFALLATGIKRFQAFRPFYTFLFQLNGFLNPLLNFGRSKNMHRALRNLLKCSAQQVQPST